MMAADDRIVDSVCHEVLVLECSQIETPSQFWDAYVTELRVKDRESFGRNLDALWDALSAGGPGWPGPVWVEVHNVERLAAYDGDFVRALETIQDDLARQDAGTRLKVMRRGEPPRGRMYQHERLLSRQLAHTSIEHALRWQSGPNTCSILWLKPHETHWQRLSLDAGFAVWEEWSDSAVEEEFEELRDELAIVDELIGQRIMVVRFDAPVGWIPEIRLELQSGATMRMYPADPNDFDSDSLYEVRG